MKRGMYHTIESRNKMREAHIGKKHTVETRKKISESCIGRPSSMLGKQHTKESITKIRKSRANQVMKPHSVETRRKIGLANHIALKGKPGHKQTGEARRKISIAAKKRVGILSPNYGKPRSEETRLKIKTSTIGRKGLEKEKNPNWKGGITPVNTRIRNSKEMANWRIQVFKRDNYVCQQCGQIGDKLQADHIYPFSLFPSKRLDINNGQTLCVDCHKKKPTRFISIEHFYNYMGIS